MAGPSEFEWVRRGDDVSRSDTISRVAGDWVVRRDRGLTPDEAAEFAAWKAEDRRHAAEFERLEQAWRTLDTMGRAPKLSTMADEVLARARARRASRRVGRWATWAAAAAAAAVVSFMGWQQFGPSSRSVASRLPKENYRVLASTVQRTILPDGSVAELNGDSRMEIAYTPTERRVKLLSGEGHFVVVKNSERPFYVSAGLVTIRAVGTAFNVRLASQKIEVLVTEGKVKLERGEASIEVSTNQVAAVEASPPLVEGQKAVIHREADTKVATVSVDEVGRAEIELELGWQSTRLVFNNTPLDEVVEGFNRYNRHRLILGDPMLKERALTGVFRADNLEGFVRLLRASVDVKAEQRTAHETVLLPIR